MKQGVNCPTRFRVSVALGELRPVIGAEIPKGLARRLELDSNHVWVQKDGRNGEVMVRGRSNDTCQEFRVPVEELCLKARQKKRLGL